MAEVKRVMRWSKTAVTDAGTGLLAEYAAGRLLDITSAFGSIGTPGDNLFELEELADGRMHPLTIENVTKNENSVTMCIQVTSLGNPTPYKLDRIGIYAKARDPGTPKPPDGTVIRDDKLLMVVEDAEDESGGKGVTIPAETDQLYTFRLYVALTITNKDRLEVSVTTAGIATIGAIHDAIKEHNENPESHSGMTARIRAAEAALNGRETIAVPKGDPTEETEGVKGQHYINLETGAEFVCTGIKDGTYTWKPVDDETSLRELLEKTAEAAASALGTPGGSEIRISFESSFAGQPYTVTDGKDTHSGVVPETLSVSVKAANCDSVYTVSVTAEDGTECSRTVATGPYYGQYHVRLSAFSATIYVTAAPGADVTAECGDAAFTAAADTGGVAAVEVDAAGIYTVRAAMAGVPSSSVNVEVTASGSSYAAKVQFLVLKVKSPAGSLLSIRKKEGSEAE